LEFLNFFKSKRTTRGGNTYRTIGKVNEVNGFPAFRGVGTLIQWDFLGIDPRKVIPLNCAKVKNRFTPTPDDPRDWPIAVVAYGSSLNKTWKHLEKFGTIFTCSGAHKFLLDRGIIPTYHVESDPRPHKTLMLGKPHEYTTYLLASIVDPSYIDFLKSQNIEKIALWHLFFMEPEFLAVLPKNEWLMTGGDTVGPRTMKIARLMGYKNLHFFGFDASTNSKWETHAGQHLNPRVGLAPIRYNGKTYITNDDWEVHAKMFLEDLDRMPEIKYTFHGEGLLQAMAKDHVRSVRSRMPLGVETYA